MTSEDILKLIIFYEVETGDELPTDYIERLLKSGYDNVKAKLEERRFFLENKGIMTF